MINAQILTILNDHPGGLAYPDMLAAARQQRLNKITDIAMLSKNIWPLKTRGDIISTGEGRYKTYHITPAGQARLAAMDYPAEPVPAQPPAPTEPSMAAAQPKRAAKPAKAKPIPANPPRQLIQEASPDAKIDEDLDDLAFMITLYIKRKNEGAHPRILRRAILALIVELACQLGEPGTNP